MILPCYICTILLPSEDTKFKSWDSFMATLRRGSRLKSTTPGSCTSPWTKIFSRLRILTSETSNKLFVLLARSCAAADAPSRMRIQGTKRQFHVFPPDCAGNDYPRSYTIFPVSRVSYPPIWIMLDLNSSELSTSRKALTAPVE